MASPPDFFSITDKDMEAYQRDGYLIVRGLLTPEEVNVVKEAVEKDLSFKDPANCISLGDKTGGQTRLNLWSNIGEGTLGMLTRSKRVVQTMQRILGGEVLHYHSKVLLKEPREGGVWNWHQDYGYWYKDFFLLPHMGTAYFAIDPQTKANGCLKILRGSHELGRIDHVSIGDQQGADPERLELALERYEEVFCELDAGDAVFFGGLTVHSSQGNFSDSRRLAFASAFTRADNVQWKNAYIPCWRVRQVDDEALMRVGVSVSSGEDKVFLDGSRGKDAGRKDEKYEEAISGSTGVGIPAHVAKDVVLPAAKRMKVA